MKKLIMLFVALALVLAACATPTTPDEPTTEATTQVRLYLATVGEAPLYTVYMETVYAETDGTPEHIVQLLVQHGALPQGTYLLDVTWHEDNTVTLNMNEGFMQGQSDAEQQRQSASLGSTFSAFFGGLTSVFFTAAGQEIEPVAPTQSQVRLYLANLGNQEPWVYINLHYANTTGTAQDIVRLLVEHGALPQGTAVHSFTQQGRSATIDMNEGFLQATGSSGEAIQVVSLVNTLLTHFNLQELYLTAAGQMIESGHETYDYPLTYRDDIPILT